MSDKHLAFRAHFNPKAWCFLREECAPPNYAPRRFTGHGPRAYHSECYESGSAVRAYEDGTIELRYAPMRHTPQARVSTECDLGADRVEVGLANDLLRRRGPWQTPSGQPVTKSSLYLMLGDDIAPNRDFTVRGSALYDRASKRLYSAGRMRYGPEPDISWPHAGAIEPTLHKSHARWLSVHWLKDERTKVRRALKRLKPVIDHRAMIEGWAGSDFEEFDRKVAAAAGDRVPWASSRTILRLKKRLLLDSTGDEIADSSAPIRRSITRYTGAVPLVVNEFWQMAETYDPLLLLLLWFTEQVGTAASLAVILQEFYAAEWRVSDYLTPRSSS